jgi:hypothetical protein
VYVKKAITMHQSGQGFNLIRPSGQKWSKNASMSFFLCIFEKSFINPNVKQVSRGEENDYGEENKMFLTLIFAGIKKDKPKHFAQGCLFPPPY